MPEHSIFITGGAGFIGSWVVECALSRGYGVAVYDNLAVGRLSNLAPTLDRIRFFEADILDEAALSAALSEVRPSTVIHLAAHHFIPFCNAHPLETMRVNVDGTWAVFRAAAAHDVVTTAVASSGVVYDSRTEPLVESDEPTLTDVYGLSKYLAEHVASYFAHSTPMRSVVARLFNTYGPRETNPHLIPHILESMKRGPVLPLGNTHTRRDYVYVEDVANLLLDLAVGPGPRFGITNVGTGREYSAAEVVAEIADLTGRQLDIAVDESRQRAADKLHQIADTTLLRERTGRLPVHGLREGLAALLRAEGLLETPAPPPERAR